MECDATSSRRAVGNAEVCARSVAGERAPPARTLECFAPERVACGLVDGRGDGRRSRTASSSGVPAGRGVRSRTRPRGQGATGLSPPSGRQAPWRGGRGGRCPGPGAGRESRPRLRGSGRPRSCTGRAAEAPGTADGERSSQSRGAHRVVGRRCRRTLRNLLGRPGVGRDNANRAASTTTSPAAQPARRSGLGTSAGAYGGTRTARLTPGAHRAHVRERRRGR